MFKLPGYAVAAAVLALVLAACGSSSSSSSTASSASSSATSTASASSAPAPAATGAKSGTLAIAADPSGQLKFTKSTLSAKAGKVTISFTNKSPVGHNLTIQEGTNGKILGATPTFQGGSQTVTVNLKPGMYTFFCSVPGHRMAGMHGVLTVS